MDTRSYDFYFVGTPIGNFDEMTYRAVAVLGSVDEIWCEDTKHSLALLSHYKINKPLQSFHKYSDENKIDLCLKKLKEGKRIAYISDAGMPCISDPGLRLSRALIENDIEYTVISGASACLNALILSGLETENFYFVGFLKDKKKERTEQIEKILNLSCTLIFYSSVHNVKEDLKYLSEKFGNRKCAVIRELTKLYEQVVRGNLAEISIDEPRGEYVICVQGAEKQTETLSPQEYLVNALSYMDYKDAIKETAKVFNVQKNEIYQIYTKMKNEKN